MINILDPVPLKYRSLCVATIAAAYVLCYVSVAAAGGLTPRATFNTPGPTPAPGVISYMSKIIVSQPTAPRPGLSYPLYLKVLDQKWRKIPVRGPVAVSYYSTKTCEGLPVVVFHSQVKNGSAKILIKFPRRRVYSSKSEFYSFSSECQAVQTRVK
jgi:hypothetical protein